MTSPTSEGSRVGCSVSPVRSSGSLVGDSSEGGSVGSGGWLVSPDSGGCVLSDSDGDVVDVGGSVVGGSVGSGGSVDRVAESDCGAEVVASRSSADGAWLSAVDSADGVSSSDSWATGCRAVGCVADGTRGGVGRGRMAPRSIGARSTGAGTYTGGISGSAELSDEVEAVVVTRLTAPAAPPPASTASRAAVGIE